MNRSKPKYANIIPMPHLAELIGASGCDDMETIDRITGQIKATYPHLYRDLVAESKALA